MTTAKRFISGLPFYGCLLLLAYMPFHVFITQYASLATGGLSVWKIAKDVVIALLAVFVICLVMKQGKITRTFEWLVGLTSLYAAIHLIMWLAHPDIYRTSAALGFTYNLRLPCFAIIGYGARLLRPDLFRATRLARWLVVVSSIVAALGLVQYYLPSDILTHFGYNVGRGVRPNFFIDNNPAFLRIMSTLRDPNSLAAYLILPICLLTMFIFSSSGRRRWSYATLLAVHAVAFWLTYSRGALLALFAALGAAVFLEKPVPVIRWIRRFWWLLCLSVIILAVGLVIAVKHNSHLSGVLTHTTVQQVGQYDSNQYHWLFVKQGLEAIAHNPLGHGPGTAGLASIQNPHGGFLTENYYVQIGYEVGVIGLIVFVTLNGLVVLQLWRVNNQKLAPQKSASHKKSVTDATLTDVDISGLLIRAILASAVGYVVMNMLFHTWSNEAVACQWWLVGGLLLAL